MTEEALLKIKEEYIQAGIVDKNARISIVGEFYLGGFIKREYIMAPNYQFSFGIRCPVYEDKIDEPNFLMLDFYLTSHRFAVETKPNDITLVYRYEIERIKYE